MNTEFLSIKSEMCVLWAVYLSDYLPLRGQAPYLSSGNNSNLMSEKMPI